MRPILFAETVWLVPRHVVATCATLAMAVLAALMLDAGLCRSQWPTHPWWPGVQAGPETIGAFLGQLASEIGLGRAAL